MNFNTKTILSIALLFLCGICADGHAKSHKKSKGSHKNKHKETSHKATPIETKSQGQITTEKVKEQPKAKTEEVKVAATEAAHTTVKEVVEITDKKIDATQELLKLPMKKTMNQMK